MARPALCLAGIASSALLAVGALGPWVETEVGTLSGLDGLGWPLLLAALVAGSLHLGALVSRTRWGLFPAVLIGVGAFLAFAGIVSLIRLAEKSSHALSLLVDAEWQSAVLSTGTRVDRAWGLTLVAASSLALVATSVIAMVLRPEAGDPGEPRLRARTSRLPAALAPAGNAPEAEAAYDGPRAQLDDLL